MKSRQRQIRTEGGLEGFQELSSGGAHHRVEGGSVLPFPAAAQSMAPWGLPESLGRVVTEASSPSVPWLACSLWLLLEARHTSSFPMSSGDWD